MMEFYKLFKNKMSKEVFKNNLESITLEEPGYYEIKLTFKEGSIITYDNISDQIIINTPNGKTIYDLRERKLKINSQETNYGPHPEDSDLIIKLKELLKKETNQVDVTNMDIKEKMMIGLKQLKGIIYNQTKNPKELLEQLLNDLQ